LRNEKQITFTTTPNGCFLVDSHKPVPKGYVLIRRKNVQIGVHRHIWQKCFGEIPEGMCVCHTCDNPPCINPEHLFLGTNQDNIDDKLRKGRQARVCGERHGNAKVTEEAVRFIRKSDLPRKTLARMHGVSERSIYNILSRKDWAHVA